MPFNSRSTKLRARFNSGESLSNDLKVVFNYEDKTETVAAGELDGWKPIEDIEEIPLTSTEALTFPPVIVLDIETTSLDAENGEVIAVGLMFGNGNGVTVQVKDGSSEKITTSVAF